MRPMKCYENTIIIGEYVIFYEILRANHNSPIVKKGIIDFIPDEHSNYIQLIPKIQRTNDFNIVDGHFILNKNKQKCPLSYYNGIFKSRYYIKLSKPEDFDEVHFNLQIWPHPIDRKYIVKISLSMNTTSDYKSEQKNIISFPSTNSSDQFTYLSEQLNALSVSYKGFLNQFNNQHSKVVEFISKTELSFNKLFSKLSTIETGETYNRILQNEIRSLKHDLLSVSDHRKAQEDYQEFIELVKRAFSVNKYKCIREAQLNLIPDLENHPAFIAFNTLINSFSPDNPAIQTIEQSHSAFKFKVGGFREQIQSKYNAMFGVTKIPNFTDQNPKKYNEFLHSDYYHTIVGLIGKEDIPSNDRLDPVIAYRHYVFSFYNTILLDAIHEIQSSHISIETLTEELNRIAKVDVMEHIDELEILEKKYSNTIPELSPILTDYLSSLLKPLGMELTDVKIHDTFDPLQHTLEEFAQESSSNSGRIQSIVRRGVKRIQGNPIRKPTVRLG